MSFNILYTQSDLWPSVGQGSSILKNLAGTFVISSVRTTLVPLSSIRSILMHWLVSHDFRLQTVFYLAKERLHMQIFQTYCYSSYKDVLCRVKVKKIIIKNQDASKQFVDSQMDIIIPCCYCVYLQNLSGLWIHVSFQFSNWKKSILSRHLRYSIMVLTLPFKLTFKYMSRPVSLHHLFESEEKK